MSDLCIRFGYDIIVIAAYVPGAQYIYMFMELGLE
jgi:hypothetical protein